jgi:ketosteroid isomerase-like protein
VATASFAPDIEYEVPEELPDAGVKEGRVVSARNYMEESKALAAVGQ